MIYFYLHTLFNFKINKRVFGNLMLKDKVDDASRYVLTNKLYLKGIYTLNTFNVQEYLIDFYKNN